MGGGERSGCPGLPVVVLGVDVAAVADDQLAEVGVPVLRRDVDRLVGRDGGFLFLRNGEGHPSAISTKGPFLAPSACMGIMDMLRCDSYFFASP